MLGVRVIPCLLLSGRGLVKTRRFRSPRYVGDPINTVKIFNDKEVDELVVLDIDASKRRREPDWPLLEEMATECFAPLGYGGGLGSLDQMRRVLRLGFEKVVLNTSALRSPELLRDASRTFGAQSVVASIDVRTNWRGRPIVHSHAGARVPTTDPVAWARQLESLGAGEILLVSVDRDGMRTGYDLPLIRAVAEAVTVPVVACGGARSTDDLSAAVAHGAAAAAAGSLFVFQGRHQAVLISFPSSAELERLFPQRAPPSAAAPTSANSLERAA